MARQPLDPLLGFLPLGVELRSIAAPFRWPSVFCSMKLPLFRLLEVVRSSYWFVPSIMSLLAILLGIVTVWLDSGPADDWLDGLGWYQSVKPEGAHEVLSTIAGSMITVAGVVFSITIVAISFAANQYGPRILTNFMGDRGNQVTLGTFVATFLYCLVVLRTIRGGDEEFVPQLSVLVGMVLALCSIGVLIYFIHHVTQSIHANSVVAAIGRQLIGSIGDHFPAHFGTPPSDEDRAAWEAGREAERRFESGMAIEIRSRENGYVQALDENGLIEAASKRKLVLRLISQPGDFVREGSILALALGEADPVETATNVITSSYDLGAKRTPAQDLLFLIDELVEVAARALSTGVNDPFSAMTSVDWLGAAAAEMARRQPICPYRLDQNGAVRLIAYPVEFDQQIARGFGRARPYLARDVNTATHTLATLQAIAEQCLAASQLDSISAEIERLTEAASEHLDNAALAQVEIAAERARDTIRERRSKISEE